MEKRIITLEVIAEQTTKSIDRLDRSISEFRSELRADLRELRSDVDRKFTWVIGTLFGILLGMLGLMAKMANVI